MAGTFIKTDATGLAHTPQTTGFTVAGGSTTRKTLTVSGDATINQSVDTTASPTFAGITIDAIAISNLENAAAGLTDVDTAIPTSAAIVDYVASQTTSAGMHWLEVTGDTSPTEIGHGYICNKAGTACACVLPATAAVGDRIGFSVKGATGLTVQAAGGDTIIVNQLTTIAAGLIKSTSTGDQIVLKCITADSVWQAETMIGNWDVETA